MYKNNNAFALSKVRMKKKSEKKTAKNILQESTKSQPIPFWYYIHKWSNTMKCKF